MEERFKEHLLSVIPYIGKSNWSIINFADNEASFIVFDELYFPKELFEDIIQFYYAHGAILSGLIGDKIKFLMHKVNFKKFVSDLYILIVKDYLDETGSGN